ncbi:hypothetical protein E3O42_11000 [Cryobacterium adonitolivorans]|uniref:Uncharacterized protein n=1 Tax=Cryobacterium adonitolivorans TaxID=1259189 RepID=A0A4R8W5U9_9MICO|nr:hypothetical protein [Cryobacterium adonitolivorans]TFC01006.1 hypothetical protein E3O42_11000 [Cryobacterium adonitolivorans]
MSDPDLSVDPARASAPSADGAGDGSQTPRQPSTRGIRSVVFGTLVAVFAPLAGFLGGTIVGSTGSMTELDPLFVWLFLGLIVGGAGAILAIVGALRWIRANHVP